MKVIELLNKIANGEEVPEKIQVYNDVFIFDHSNMVYEHEKTKTNLFSIYNGNILNYGARAIEKDKKIKHKKDYFDFAISSDDVKFSYLYKMGTRIMDKINSMEAK